SSYADEMKISNCLPHSSHYACVLAELDDYENYQYTHNVQDVELIKYAVRNIFEEYLQHKGYVFEYAEHQLGLIYYISPNLTEQENDMTILLSKIVEQVKLFAKTAVSVGIGTIVDSYDQVTASFAEAKQALQA